MDDKKPAEGEAAKPADGQPATQAVPQDGLEKTSEELQKEGVDTSSEPAESTGPDGKPLKKPSGIKLLMRKFNVYLLGFGLVVAIVGATGVVSYLNSKKQPVTPTVASQELSADALKQLANSDATVGSASQTLTIQGNTIVQGQMLVRKDLDVAGNIRLGGDLTVSTLTVSGSTNLADTQINKLQVANDTAIQGTTDVHDLNVAGDASFSGALDASQITVTRLIMSGNAVLQVPNHITFSGGPPNRTIDTAVLGAGGTASISGSDMSGSITINSGNGPVAGCFVRVTFNQSFSNMPHVIISPINAAAANIPYYVTKSQTVFSVCTASPAPANSVFGFDYWITN
jgi:hypothetical protein